MSTPSSLSDSALAASEEQTQWMPVSDLMAGLMMVFLLLAVLMMRQVMLAKDDVRDFRKDYLEGRAAIHQALEDEFGDDLPRWEARLDPNRLEIAFLSPEVLFPANEYRLTERYELILSDFFPRYMAALRPFHERIDEVRIEGHTSSEWRGAEETDAYFANMELSQDRTRSVLRFVHDLPGTRPYAPWVRSSVAAVGLSSAKAVVSDAGTEDRIASRRVTFRVMTDADDRIRELDES